MKKRISALLAVLMVFSLMAGALQPSALAAQAPAPIQQTYEVDGVTYFDVGSNNFAINSMKFYKDLLSTRTSLLAYEYKAHHNSADDAPEVATYDQCIGDAWLRLGACMLEHLPPAGYSYGDMWTLDEAAVRGSGYTEDGSYYYSATRYDMVQQPTLKEAENWALQKAFGTTKDFGYFKENTEEQPVLVTALGEYENAYGHRKALAAYFTNFQVYAMMPADEGSNYVTELVSDDINSEFTTASTVKNLTASTVTGSQTVSNSTTATVSSQTSGSELYSYNEGIKVGGEYKFTDAFKANVEVSFTASQAFGKGWGHGQSVSDSKSVSYTMSVPLAPYTQAMLTQRDKTSVFLTTYNCPIALRYDVTLVLYNDDGIMHISYKSPSISRDTVFQFADVTSGARGDLYKRNAACETAGDWDREYLYWRAMDDLGYHGLSGTDARDTLITHVPISATGASFLQTLNVVSSEVSGLMPTHPLYRVKIAEPGTAPLTETMSYASFDYLSMKMEVGDSSYANYMKLVGVNQFDEPFYGFSKDNGYWIVVDKQGNPIDGDDGPVKLEKDPVSTNWRYTAVRPGTCFLVYQINEDAYYIADKPDDPIKNRDLKKTAALEIIVTEKDPTDSIVVTGSYQGRIDADPEPLEADDRLAVAVYDETGKEITKPYTWEAKELRGITVTPDGMVSFTKAGTYHVRAVNGKLRSDWHEITALGHVPPTITAQPTAVSALEGENAVFTVSATGDDLTYQWQYSADNGASWKDSAAASGSKAKLSFKAKPVYDGRLYRCVVTDSHGAQAISDAVKLRVRESIVINTQPKPVTVNEGEKARFSVVATGTGLTYQWQYSVNSGASWVNSTATSARTATLAFTPKASYSGRLYRCIITDVNGKQVITAEVPLTVKAVLRITANPQDVTVPAGEKVTFSVKATGSGLTYRWEYSRDGGETWKESTAKQAPSISMTAKASFDGRLYRCVVTDAEGQQLVSEPARITITAASTQ